MTLDEWELKCWQRWKASDRDYKDMLARLKRQELILEAFKLGLEAAADKQLRDLVELFEEGGEHE